MAADVIDWHDCYEKSLVGFIAPESFCHPAKFSLALIERIFDYALSRGWLKQGDAVGDPFAGVGIGGLVAAYRGLRWYGVELEPRFVDLARLTFERHESKWIALGNPAPMITKGDSRHFAEIARTVFAVITSPPYEAGLGHGGGTGRAPHDTTGSYERKMQDGYAGMVTSPPYENRDLTGERSFQSRRAPHRPLAKDNPHEGYAGMVTSPPYADSVNAQKHGIDWSKIDFTKACSRGRKRGGDSKHAKTFQDQLAYGKTEGQIGKLKGGSVEAVVTSPPWGKNCEGGRSAAKFKTEASALLNKRGHGASDQAVLAQAKRDRQKSYGKTPGNIGLIEKETYWQAMATVYAECFKVIRPGGFIAVVVKDYVRNKQRVPLCDDTGRLLEAIGFVITTQTRAWLVREQHEPDLFTGQTTKRTERKSFFRRLTEAKPGAIRIDYETVLFAHKPT